MKKSEKYMILITILIPTVLSFLLFQDIVFDYFENDFIITMNTVQEPSLEFTLIQDLRDVNSILLYDVSTLKNDKKLLQIKIDKLYLEKTDSKELKNNIILLEDKISQVEIENRSLEKQISINNAGKFTKDSFAHESKKLEQTIDEFYKNILKLEKKLRDEKDENTKLMKEIILLVKKISSLEREIVSMNYTK